MCFWESLCDSLIRVLFYHQLPWLFQIDGLLHSIRQSAVCHLSARSWWVSELSKVNAEQALLLSRKYVSWYQQNPKSMVVSKVETACQSPASRKSHQSHPKSILPRGWSCQLQCDLHSSPRQAPPPGSDHRVLTGSFGPKDVLESEEDGQDLKTLEGR